jgi:hypothetical protein
MNEIIVYHGATEIVRNPICYYGRKNLDFGMGFYVTDMRQQAIGWANIVSGKRKMLPILNRYILRQEELLSEARSKRFEHYDKEWLDFIVACRSGSDIYLEYDYVEGGVANDRVIDTINLYMNGLMDINTALVRLAYYKPNNQICLLNQVLTDKFLKFDGTEKI